jgi:UDP-glucose 4-epimerase
MSKNVVVTGAHGFIGRHVARKFSADGWNVVGIGHGSWIQDEWQQWGLAEWHVADINLDSLSAYAGRPDVIVHCAGSGSVGFSMTHPYQDFQRTVATTLAVLEFARLYAPQARVAYPSSAGVYGIVQKLPIAETDPLSPASPYGVHKRLAEDLCASYARHFDISVAVVRLFSVYGVGLRKQLLWDASQKIMGGGNGFFGTGEEIRDWLHVEDAADLLLTAAGHASSECPMVNGGSGVGVTVREVLTELFGCFERADVPNFTGAARSGDPVGYVADISIAKQWGWKPKMELHEGLREYAQWFKRSAL